uniref:Uncharacterized protein n=1 Tax=Panagrolaimus sp. ES5 TaxID=591445 RepID=A0AC34FDU2_9BILA
MVLASNVENLFLLHSTVKYNDGTEVPLEKIVEQIPKVKSITLHFPPATSMITSQTMKELCEIPHFATLESIIFKEIPESFNLASFCSYMKKNKLTYIILGFCDSISEGYKVQLEEIVDGILEAQTREYIIPNINFPGLDAEKYQKLLDFYK